MVGRSVYILPCKVVSDYRRQRRKAMLASTQGSALLARVLFILPAPLKGNNSHAIRPLQAGAAALLSFSHAMLLGNFGWI